MMRRSERAYGNQARTADKSHKEEFEIEILRVKIFAISLWHILTIKYKFILQIIFIILSKTISIKCQEITI